MKRAKDLLKHVAEPDNLRLAFWKARKGKSYSREVEFYRNRLEENLFDLRKQILTGKIEVGDYRYFKVFEPKERQICASAFREQVLHHALMNICHPYFEKSLSFDSYASRKNKGTYAAIERAKRNTQRYTFFLKLDVRKFFESVHHDVLKDQLSRMFKDYEILNLFDQIIDSYEAHPKRGLPIGNLTSQYFANEYLSELDHFIKENLQIKAYVRYMDDMVLWHDDKFFLRKVYNDIKDYVENKLKCMLKPELLNYSSCGLPFLGYLIRPHNIRLSQNSKQRFIKEMNIVEENYSTGNWTESYCQQKALPLLAFVQHAETKSFRKNYFSK